MDNITWLILYGKTQYFSRQVCSYERVPGRRPELDNLYVTAAMCTRSNAAIFYSFFQDNSNANLFCTHLSELKQKKTYHTGTDTLLPYGATICSVEDYEMNFKKMKIMILQDYCKNRELHSCPTAFSVNIINQ